MLTISFGSDPERTNELVDTIFDTIEDLKEKGPTEREVSDAREAMLRSFETSLQQNRTYLAQLTADYRRGEVPGESLRTYPSSIKELTPVSIRAAARKYLNMNNRIQVTLMPKTAVHMTNEQ